MGVFNIVNGLIWVTLFVMSEGPFSRDAGHLVLSLEVSSVRVTYVLRSVQMFAVSSYMLLSFKRFLSAKFVYCL